MIHSTLPDFKAKKRLGQNFLINAGVVEKMILAAALRGNETILEVGPGFGILTQALLTSAASVIAIEKDRELYEFLKNKFYAAKNLELIHGDALQIPPPKPPYTLIANIPYSITSPLLDHYIRDNAPALPENALVMVQKEVAEKICAHPPRMNVLALHVQVFGTPRIVAHVSRNNFRPVPKVDSVIVEIDFVRQRVAGHRHGHGHREAGHGGTDGQWGMDLKLLFETIHQGFSHKRKMLRGVFDETVLKKAGIDATRRAETLSIAEWFKLAPPDEGLCTCP